MACRPSRLILYVSTTSPFSSISIYLLSNPTINRQSHDTRGGEKARTEFFCEYRFGGIFVHVLPALGPAQ